MHWIAYTLISAFTGSIAKVLQRTLIANQTHHPAALAFVFQLLVGSIFFLYTLTTNTFELPPIETIWLPVVVMTLLYGIGNIYTFKAFQKAEAAEVAVIFASSSIWSALTALVLLRETITPTQWLGIVLISLGVVVVSYRKTQWKLNQGHLFALLAALCFGIAFTNDAFIITAYTSVSAYMVLAFTLPGFMVLFLQPKAIPTLPTLLQPKIIIRLLICVAFYALSALTIFTAYKQGGSASVISPLHQTSLLFTVALSYFFLHERGHILQKVVGAMVVCAGAAILI